MNFLIHKINRKRLVEGRSSGIVMGLAKKYKIQDGITLKLKTGLSACKDYLNDVCAVENSNFEGGFVYGFKYTKGDYKIKNRNYIVARNESKNRIVTEDDLMSNLFQGDALYKQVEALNYSENIENAQFLISRIETEIFNFKKSELTTISKITEYVSNDDKVLKNPLLIFEFSSKWMNNQINISMYSGLIRRAICIKEFSEDEKNLPILDFIKMISRKPNLGEGFELNYFLENSIEDIRLLFNSNLKHLPVYLKYSSINSTVHSFGLGTLITRIKEESFNNILIKLNLKTANDTVTI